MRYLIASILISLMCFASCSINNKNHNAENQSQNTTEHDYLRKEQSEKIEKYRASLDKSLFIRVRIFIETCNARICVGKDVPGGIIPPSEESLYTVAARTQLDLSLDVLYASNIYEKAKIYLMIDSINFIEPSGFPMNDFSDFDRYRKNPNNPVDSLNIVYVFSCGGTSPFTGVSSFPWEDINNTIVIIGDRASDSMALAHEIGHYLGLMHTFEEDYVDDTKEFPSLGKEDSLHRSDFIGKPDYDPEFDNLMSYGGGSFITPQQLKKARYFAEKYKQNNMVTEYASFQPFMQIDNLYLKECMRVFEDQKSKNEKIYYPEDMSTLLEKWKAFLKDDIAL